MAAHRHVFTVTRYVRSSGEPMVKTCRCGRTWRHHRGRWTLTSTGRA